MIIKKNNFLIKGAGMGQTVLSFKKLKSGGEGMKIVGNSITIQDLTIKDTLGDGIKSQYSDGITFRRINVNWTNGDKSKNGTFASIPCKAKMY